MICKILVFDISDYSLQLTSHSLVFLCFCVSVLPGLGGSPAPGLTPVPVMPYPAQGPSPGSETGGSRCYVGKIIFSHQLQ